MKNISFLAAVLLCGTVIVTNAPGAFAEQPYNWNLLWSGSWNESDLTGTLNNRVETVLHYLPLDLLWRGQILGRRPFNLNFNSPWGDPDKVITHYTMGLYHKPTGSRLLSGPLEEAGLPARIRNPWIRSPPYAENRTNTVADLRTTVSSSREDEIYLYLASPLLEISQNVLLKTFFSAQTETDELTPAFSFGLDFRFPKNTRFTAEMFYTERTLQPKEESAWFSDPPPLPERDFRLIAAGLLFKNAYFSVSSDFALSEAFSRGSDIYANLGVSFSPIRPLTLSLALDGSGPRFINRDGADYAEGFRSAAKIEWRSAYNSLFKIDSVLRADAFGRTFNRSSTDIYYRFPSSARDKSPVKISTVSLSADRNAENHLKIRDSYSGGLRLLLNLEKNNLKNPLRINLTGTVNGLSKGDIDVNPFPVPSSDWTWESAAINCEFIWTLGVFQLRSKTGCTINAKKDEKWDFSASASTRFKQGRLTVKTASADFPKKWNFSASWRLEIHGKSQK